MKRKGLSELSGIKIEGGALSTSVLHSLMARKLESSDAASYHIEEGYTIGERIAEEWNRTRSSWNAFTKERERMGSEPGAGITRDRFLLPLFERLGYGRLAYAGGIEAGGERYAITHRWGDVPIHLVGADTDLDSRAAGVAGAARRSPHGLVLEYLNRGTANPWGFVSNGNRLRLLRENRSIVRQSYIEFDLEGIIEGESYADFTALWLLCHQSRLEGKGDAHILERWREAGIKEGERALEELRTGMEKTISSLGTGLISHPANTLLREALRNGDARGGLDTEGFYHELLRLAYRFIFLFVAEDRDVLLDPLAPAEAKKRYAEHYSTRRLRDLARSIRGGGHGDLWRGLVTVMDLLADKGCPDLALPALGSFLWERESIAHLAACEIANRDLLGAIRELAFTLRGGALWPTDFRNLGSEELGSVYESLLELHTELNLEGGSFNLATAPGHERKTSGSYYTPTSLVERLLDEALDPVLERAVKEKEPEAAILSLRVCDPAMGSGHFLTGAARRIAKALAAVRTGDPEPGPEPLRHAMADVVQHCVYGVDLNPLAVELCKISLWMEALEPGRPLSFLDHHLKCGNSLIGATRELMKKGIPEGAFSGLTGDDKTTVRAARKRNSEELAGERDLPATGEEPFPDYGKIAESFSKLGGLDETTLEGVRLLATRYRSIVEAPEYLAELSAANGWCAAFFQPKRPDAPEPITQGRFSVWLGDPLKVPKTLRDLAENLAGRARFFHWELAFPEVFRPAGGGAGGFDAVLGNPPWERIKLQETEWFAERDPAIALAPNASARKKMIARLETDGDPLFGEYRKALHDAEAMSVFIRQGGRYPLCGKGDVNLFSVFTELARCLLAPEGRLGIIVPSGIATDDTTKDFFADMVRKRVLVSLYDFENHGIFPSVHNSYKFCLLTVAGSPRPAGSPSRFVFFAHSVAELEEPERLIELTDQDFLRMNPNTGTAPIFRSRRDAEITRKVYERVPVLIREGPPEENPWGITFMRMLDMANDSGLFRTRTALEEEGFRLEGNRFVKGKAIWLPLYEAKMTAIFDHRAADVIKNDANVNRQQQPIEIIQSEKIIVGREAIPFFWVEKKEVDSILLNRWNKQWLIGWRDITSSTNERTTQSAIIPISGVGDTFLLMFPSNENGWINIASINSFIIDYCARQKLGGLHIKYHVFKQLPVLSPAFYSVICPWDREAGTVADWIRPRVLELVYTSHSLEPFARDLGYAGPPFAWDAERRFSLRCELDAAFFHLYGISREDADYILDTFPIVKKHDEAEFGEYRTKRVILERYEEYGEAMRRVQPEGSRLAAGAGPEPDKDLPAVPAPPTLAGLLEYLSRLGVEVENNRPLGGGLWVYRGRAGFGALAEHLKKSGVDVKYYPEGRKKRAGEQYEIDPGKRLR